MSTDYSAVCVPCRISMHLCQVGRGSFGWGTGDVVTERRQCEFISEHAHHNLKIVLSDYIPEGCTDFDLSHEAEWRKDTLYL